MYGEFTSVNLSTRLSRDGLKKIIKNANKCYFDWAIGYALYDSMVAWDYIEIDPDYLYRYYRVNSSTIKTIKDVKAKMLPYFSESFCNSVLYGENSFYMEKNGKLYLLDGYEEGASEKLRLDSVSYSIQNVCLKQQ